MQDDLKNIHIKELLKNYNDILSNSFLLTPYIKDKIMNDLININDVFLNDIVLIKKKIHANPKPEIITYKYNKWSNDISFNGLLLLITEELKSLGYINIGLFIRDVDIFNESNNNEELFHKLFDKIAHLSRYFPIYNRSNKKYETEIDLSLFKINPFTKNINNIHDSNDLKNIKEFDNNALEIDCSLNYNDFSLDNIKFLIQCVEQNINLLEYYKLIELNSRYVITNNLINNILDMYFDEFKNSVLMLTVYYDYAKHCKIKKILIKNLDNYIFKYLLNEINNIDIAENEIIPIKLSNIEFQKFIAIIDFILIKFSSKDNL